MLDVLKSQRKGLVKSHIEHRGNALLITTLSDLADFGSLATERFNCARTERYTSVSHGPPAVAAETGVGVGMMHDRMMHQMPYIVTQCVCLARGHACGLCKMMPYEWVHLQPWFPFSNNGSLESSSSPPVFGLTTTLLQNFSMC